MSMKYDDLHSHADHYKAIPGSTALLTVDYQIAFGELEPVPDARAALDAYGTLATAWRQVGGRVIHLYTEFETPAEAGLLVDFAPGVVDALAVGSPQARFFDGVVQAGDLCVRKTRFSGVLGSDILAVLNDGGFGSVIVCGLTTPICVQTTVDALQMSGIRVILAEDACASQAMGDISAQDAHRVAVERMRYVMARVAGVDDLIDEIHRSNPTETR